jgi:DNA-binding transcriptional regulator YiaG
LNKKYFELQKEAQLSNSQSAELLEVNISTIKRWRNGSVDAPKAVLMALELYILKQKENKHEFN